MLSENDKKVVHGINYMFPHQHTLQAQALEIAIDVASASYWW